jgi:uncharacterized OsmC-like protein
MVAAAMGIETRRIEVRVDGDLDLRGTLGVDPTASVGFQSIRLHFDVDAPGADADDIVKLKEKTTRYCVVLATLNHPPTVEVAWS